jgi:Autotransporter beta-domain/Bacterial Ig-like domain (group 3)/IPT/TIG domain
VVTPAHSSGLVDVGVTTPAGTGIGTNLYSYQSSPPTVTGLSPATGTTQGLTRITITGTNFTGTPQVTVGGAAAQQVTVVNSTTISALTPPGTGAVQVQVMTSFGTSAANPPSSTYTYTTPVTPPPPAPTVTSVSPGSGTTLGLTPVTITGTNFTGATAVTFGGNAATGVTVVNSTTISALTPPGALGSVAVTVTTPGGTGTALAAYQYVTAPPTVTAVNPNTGASTGGSTVQITGTNFTGATALTFDGIAAPSFTVLNATTITATTPAHAAGAVNVAATTPAGTGTGVKLFTYLAQPLPTVTTISPNSGNTAGGTQVTITGTNLNGASSVTFDGIPATFVSVPTATGIIVVAPAHTAPGAVSVVVTTPAGSVTGTFTYVEGPPTVTAISPSSGPMTGGTAVTITGTNFTGATAVTIGGNTPTAVTFVSATSITATTTAHAAGAVNVVVTTPVGTATGTNLFTYDAPVSVLPTVTAVTPNTGPSGGGTSVTITGTNLTGATAVIFGGAAATFVNVVSATSITARSPAGSGTVNVSVTTPTGTSAAAPGAQFIYGKATTSLALTSSPNPSAIGQPVVFTARVTGNNPTGSVIFTENGQTVGTAMLVNGIATFMISTLPAGNNAVTASYPGDANNTADPQTVIQVVNGVSDSARLHQMQSAVMPVVTNLSGQAISSAIDNAISAGFGGACQLVSPNGGGFTYCFDGDASAQPRSLAMEESHLLPDQRQILEHDFAALGFAEEAPAAKKAPAAPPPHDWLGWLDVRAAEFRTTTLGSDLQGTQVNGTAGITRRLTPDFLVGVVGGYEHFDFTSQAYNGALKGDGFTAGGYVGWRLTSTVRFDASGAWSDISAADSSGAATGNFTGHRWFASAGATGNYAWAATVIEPSARVYMLWEQENAYTDSLGTAQPSHTFDTGRGSAGVKVSHMFAAGLGTLAPYVGLYGDYYFSKDDATTTTTPALAAVTPILQGGSARATGGVTMMFDGGKQLSFGGEYSGIGQNTRIWNLQLHGSVSF